MNVRDFLGLLGDRPLSSVKPEGRMVIDLINRYVDQPYEAGDLTGITACEAIDALDQKDRNEIYASELNDGMDLVQYRRELQSLLDQKDGDGKQLRRILAFGMATLLAALTLSLSWAIVYVAWVKNELPPWELCLIAFGGPAMVVWQYNGVLTQERKDFLAAALGRTPQAGIIGGLLSSMGNSRDVRRRRSDMDEDDFRPRNRYHDDRGDRGGMGSGRGRDSHGGPPAV